MPSRPRCRNPGSPCSNKFEYSSLSRWQLLHRRRLLSLQFSNLVPWADSAVWRQLNPPRCLSQLDEALRRIKRQRRFGRDVHVADQRSFFKNAALIVAQDLSDATEFINETCDSSVGGTHHWAPIFDTSKNGVGQMLTRTG